MNIQKLSFNEIKKFFEGTEANFLAVTANFEAGLISRGISKDSLPIQIPPQALNIYTSFCPDEYVIEDRVYLDYIYLSKDNFKPLDISYRFSLPREVIMNICRFKQELTIRCIQSSNKITFNSCTFEEGISLKDCNLKNVLFSKCTFKNSFKLNCTVESLQLIDCEFGDMDLDIEAVNLDIQNLSVNSCNINGIIDIIKISDSNKSDSSEISIDAKFKGLGIKNNELINRLKINFHADNSDGRLTIENSNFKELLFTGNNLKIKSYLKNISSDELGFRDFINDSVFLIQQFIINSFGKFIVINSTLGKMELNGFYFKENRVIDFTECKISDISISNVDFPALLHRYKTFNSNTKRDFIRQVKLLYSKQSDLIKEKEFEKLEYFALEKTNLISIGDRIILYLNRISNKNNQDFLRAFYWITVTSIILWIGITYSFGIVIGNPILIKNWDLFCKFVPNYFQFLNPVRPFNFLENFSDKLNLKNNYKNGDFVLAEVIDSLSRVVLIYLEYQFVQAFRKFGKK